MIAAVYLEIKGEFSETLSDFELMWDGHLGRIDIAKHWILLSPADAKQTHSAPLWADEEEREF